MRGDEDMLHVLRGINNDLVTAEAKYHKNCFFLYIKQSGNQMSNTDQTSLSEDAFQELLNDLTPSIYRKSVRHGLASKQIS